MLNKKFQDILNFECVDNDGYKYFVEIKGCKGNIESVRLTENEWKVAKKNHTNTY